MTDLSLGFAQNPLDRAHPQRTDSAWIEAERSREDVRLIVIAGEDVVFRGAGNPQHPSGLFRAEDAERLVPQADELYLGRDPSGVPVFARIADATIEDTAAAAIETLDMRSLAIRGPLPVAEVSMAAMARSLGLWHRTHRFCARCGAPTTITLGGFRRDCPDCGAQHFPRTDPVVIMLIVDGDRALIARSAHFVGTMYSTIAGFMEPGETIEQAVARETVEETGITVGAVHYLMSQPWPFPSSLMIGCHAVAATTEIRIDPEELEDAFWASKAELAAAFEGRERFMLPPQIAIAHHLIRAFLDG